VTKSRISPPYIRENQGQLFTDDYTDLAQQIPTPSVAEKATKLLRFIAKEHPYAGEQFSIPVDTAYSLFEEVNNHGGESFTSEDASTVEACRELLPYIAASWSRNASEFMFLVDNNLIKRRFLEDMGSRRFRIAPEGWSYLETLEKPSHESTTAFVAMWFNPKTEPLWKQGIWPAIYEAGYEPVRIDAMSTVTKATMRSSRKFAVANFLWLISPASAAELFRSRLCDGFGKTSDLVRGARGLGSGPF
jgi:hypothetical protein